MNRKSSSSAAENDKERESNVRWADTNKTVPTRSSRAMKHKIELFNRHKSKVGRIAKYLTSSPQGLISVESFLQI